MSLISITCMFDGLLPGPNGDIVFIRLQRCVRNFSDCVMPSHYCVSAQMLCRINSLIGGESHCIQSTEDKESAQESSRFTTIKCESTC
eukprot:scaffold185904_cov40-Prasinocladus_malaysianus.AAC.1